MQHINITRPKFEDFSYHNEAKGIFGCKHYPRKVLIQADCCGKWFSCRLCHDEVSSHEMPRKDTKRMCCSDCLVIQPPQKNCQACQSELSGYYCSICKFWDDTPGKSIYHCKGCGICRVGKGPNIDYIHCYRCTLCVPSSMYSSHKCMEYNSKADCPICGEYLFTTIKPIIFMPCQHMIHTHCHDILRESSFQCPICRKSLSDCHEKFLEIDMILRSQPSKAKFLQQLRQEIQCYDCDSTSYVEFHPLFHKCTECDSYSTKLLDTFNPSYSINSKRDSKIVLKNNQSDLNSNQASSGKLKDMEACSISTLVSDLNNFYPYHNYLSGDESDESLEDRFERSSYTCSCDGSNSYCYGCSSQSYSEFDTMSSYSNNRF